MISFPVAALLGTQQGSREDYDIEETLEFTPEEELILTSPVTAQVMLMNMDHEIHVGVYNLKASAQVNCNRCTKQFTFDISVPETGRQFILDLPKEDIGETEDVSYIDQNRNEIDIEPLLREELLLHFPAFPVCSDGCKGICTTCGVDKNIVNCTCNG